MTPEERRVFLIRAFKSFLLIITAILIIPFVIFFKSKKSTIRSLEFFFVTDEDNLPRRGVKGFEVKYSKGSVKIFIVRNGVEIFALSSQCTHLGCSVNWNRDKKEFLCPCHGGRYSINGEVIGGPPPQALSRLPVKFIDGNLYVGLKV